MYCKVTQEPTLIWESCSQDHRNPVDTRLRFNADMTSYDDMC